MLCMIAHPRKHTYCKMKLSPFLHTFLEYTATFLWFGNAFIDHYYCVSAAHDVCPLLWSFGILVSIAVLTTGSVLGMTTFFGSIRLCRDHICLTVLEGFLYHRRHYNRCRCIHFAIYCKHKHIVGSYRRGCGIVYISIYNCSAHWGEIQMLRLTGNSALDTNRA